MTDYFKGNEIKQAFEYSEGFVSLLFSVFKNSEFLSLKSRNSRDRDRDLKIPSAKSQKSLNSRSSGFSGIRNFCSRDFDPWDTGF